MAGRAITITSRIVFFVCGLTSLLTAAPYVESHGVDLPAQSEWIVFAVALALVGIFSVTFAALPRSWIAKVCKKDRDDQKLLSAPLKLLGLFATVFYLLALVAFLAPHSWDLDPQLMLALCPLYAVKMLIDPSLVAVFFLFAPMNAAAYGALGLTLGCARAAFRNRRSS